MPGDPMSHLAAAHIRLIRAKATLAAAATAVEAAQKFAAEASIELAGHIQKNEDAVALRSGELMRSLKLGGKPAWKSPALAADHVAKVEAQQRADVARQALAELAGEETAAAKAVAEADAAVHEAARGVIGAEVDATVSKVIELEAEAMRLRVEIEGVARSSVVGWGTQIALSTAGKNILVGNQSSGLAIKNDPAWHDANAAAESCAPEIRVPHRRKSCACGNCRARPGIGPLRGRSVIRQHR